MAVPIVIPKEGQSMETAIITGWRVKKGDGVKIGDILCEVESQKASFDIESPVNGVVLDILFDADTEVPVFEAIAYVGNEGEKYDIQQSPNRNPDNTVMGEDKNESQMASAKSYEVSVERTEAFDSGKVEISPRAKKLALDKGIPLEKIIESKTGAGPIIEKDVLKYIQMNQPQARTITSDQTSAQYTLNCYANVAGLLDYRNNLKKSPVNFGLNGITINDMLLFIVAKTLSGFKEINSHFFDEKIIQFEDVHLAFAVDTGKGPVFPVIRNANLLSLKEVSDEAKRLTGVCREGRIDPDKAKEGTFTVSNLGRFGIDTFTPILNKPQVGILGVGGISPKPVFRDGKYEFVNHMGLSLTVSHQVPDGAAAARFLQAISLNIANIEMVLSM